MSNTKIKTYLVGGAVRDYLLGLESKDKDYVVVGADEDYMLSRGFEKVGKDFPVFLHPQTREEYALARKERKVAAGYSGFEFDTKNVTLKDDLLRRDLTINAMAIDLESNTVIDYFGGQNDLKQGILRHVSAHFSEDPVRILRIARFAARYNFDIAQDTLDMLKEMVNNGEANHLVPDRIIKEFDKAFGEKHLKKFFIVLEQVGLLNNLGNFSTIMQDLSILEKSHDITDEKDFKKQNTFNLVFQNFSPKEMREFKIEAQTIDEIELFKEFKNSPPYQEMSTKAKLGFLKKNKAIHNNNIFKRIALLDFINQQDTDTEELLRDINIIKNFDYETLIKSTSDKKNIGKIIESTQESLIEKAQSKKSIRP